MLPRVMAPAAFGRMWVYLCHPRPGILEGRLCAKTPNQTGIYAVKG
jgi:hypothetical protein